MEKLIAGLHHFRDQVVPSNRRFYRSLAEGQAPSTLFITCCDSRINPNLITQTAPGELFVVRNAGCLVPPYHEGDSESASIEYAVAVLKVRDVVVCGHSYCGAMTAIAEHQNLDAAPALRRWLRHAERTREIVEQNYLDVQGTNRINVTVQENVLVQLEHLRTHPAVAAALQAGTLQVHGWVYKVETGDVYIFDHEIHQFVSITGNTGGLAAKPTMLNAGP